MCVCVCVVGGGGVRDWGGRGGEIDSLFSMVILSLPLIQERQLQLSVSAERMCTILVNHLDSFEYRT